MSLTLDENGFGPLYCFRTADGRLIWDFTLLFEDAILVSGPLALGILCSLTEFTTKLRRKAPRTTRSFHGILGWAKLTLHIALVALTATNIVLLCTLDDILVSRLSYAAAAISFVFLLVAAANNLFHHVKYLKPSSPVQLFMAWWLLSDIATIRTRWLFDGANLILTSTMTASAAIKFAVLLVEELSKRHILLPCVAQPSSEALSGILNRLLMLWISPLMYQGLTGVLTLQDLPRLEDQFTTSRLLDRFRKDHDGPAKSSSGTNLFTTLLKDHWRLWFAPFPIRIAQAAFEFTQPFLITRTLYWLYFPSPDSTAIGYGLLGAFVIVYIGVAISTAFGQYQSFRLITTIRGDLMTRIFRKTLKCKLPSMQDLAPVTLMSTNLDRMVDGLQYLQEAIVAIPQLGVALWLLARQAGLGAIGPVAIVCVAAVGMGSCAPAMDKAQRNWLNAVKTRVAFATQVLVGFQSARMSGLMDLLADRLQDLRVIEIRVSIVLRRFLVLVHSLALGTPCLTPVVTLGIYAAMRKHRGDSVNEVQAFSAIAYLNLITIPLLVVVGRLPNIVGAYTAMKQIGDFLAEPQSQSASRPVEPLDEMHPGATDPVELHDSGDAVITIANCSLRPSPKREPVLRNLNIQIMRSTFTFIVGPSASGKTSLLEAILGEYSCSEGSLSSVFALQDVAYAAQRPWLRSGSIKSNIMASAPLDELFYQEVIRACALDQDAGHISHDTTSGGANLSGGQKQKVSLARAVYSRRKLLIIDEPFTGIDGISCEQILQRLLGPSGLLRKLGTTVIVASHSAKYLSLADHVVVLGCDQRIAQQGHPKSLALKSYTGDEPARKEGPLISGEIAEITAGHTTHIPTAQGAAAKDTPQDRRQGEVATYIYYFASLGWWKLVFAGACIASFVFFQLFCQPWVTWWTRSSDSASHLGYWLGLFAFYGAMAIISLAAASWLMLVVMVTSSGVSLHATLCDTIARAPLTLFSRLSPGLTINRFSQDMSLVDMELPLSFASLAITFMLCLGQLGLILSASKWASIALPFVVGACIFIQRLYVKTSRQLRFLEIESKAPLYTHFIETLNGLATVRAYHLQTVLEDEAAEMIDVCQKPFYLLYCAQRFLGLTLNFIVAALAVLLVGIAIAIRGHGDTLFYGTALVNVMTFGTYMAQYISEWTQFEINLAAVERTKEFAEQTPKEVTSIVDDTAEEPFKEGEVQITKLSVNYRNGQQALRNVSLSIPAGQKVAICGRSGSGKSTLCFAMLRMLEAAEGNISLDGRQIAHIPHESLRTHIACVPQDPLLLEGTLRYNLDPFEECTDLEISQILDTVGLRAKFGMQQQGLATTVTPTSLSARERQLLCLARALLKKSKLLVLDEASSGMDAASDHKVQDVICQKLPGVTVMSVMHRFDSIRLYDRVVLIAGGSVVEDGTPQALLADSASQFSQLYRSEQQGSS